jgi:hypothetical protein
MLSLYAREVLVHELHARKASADQAASYAVIIAKYIDGALSTIPCPRCYADGRAVPLIVVSEHDVPFTASCDGCAVIFDLRA